MHQKAKIKENAQKPSRWLRFYDFYGKHLVVISFILIGVSSLILFFSELFEIYVQLPLFGSVRFFFLCACMIVAVTIPHERIVRGMAKKEMHQYEILAVENYGSLVAQLSLGAVLAIFAGIVVIAYFFPDMQIEQTLSAFIFGVFLYFYMLTISSSLVLMGHRFIPSDVRARLCLGVVLENLLQLNQLKPLERQRHVKKYFRWFEDGLGYYNAYIMKTLPNHPKVKEIEVYCDSAYLIALTGTKDELKKLAKYINESYVSLGKKRKDVDFRSFLTSLQHIRGKRTKRDESVYELSRLFETVPFSARIMPKIKSMAAISIAIITLVAAIVEIMKYFQ